MLILVMLHIYGGSGRPERDEAVVVSLYKCHLRSRIRLFIRV